MPPHVCFGSGWRDRTFEESNPLDVGKVSRPKDAARAGHGEPPQGRGCKVGASDATAKKIRLERAAERLSAGGARAARDTPRALLQDTRNGDRKIVPTAVSPPGERGSCHFRAPAVTVSPLRHYTCPSTSFSGLTVIIIGQEETTTTKRHINGHTAVHPATASELCINGFVTCGRRNHLGSRASGMQGSLDTGNLHTDH